jgi:hypothetical protein
VYISQYTLKLVLPRLAATIAPVCLFRKYFLNHSCELLSRTIYYFTFINFFKERILCHQSSVDNQQSVKLPSLLTLISIIQFRTYPLFSSPLSFSFVWGLQKYYFFLHQQIFFAFLLKYFSPPLLHSASGSIPSNLINYSLSKNGRAKIHTL